MITGQAGPAWLGRVIARVKHAAVLDVVLVLVFSVSVLVLCCALAGLAVRAGHPAPVYVPTVFCPAGQHVVSGSAGGQPFCQANH